MKKYIWEAVGYTVLSWTIGFFVCYFLDPKEGYGFFLVPAIATVVFAIIYYFRCYSLNEDIEYEELAKQRIEREYQRKYEECKRNIEYDTRKEYIEYRNNIERQYKELLIQANEYKKRVTEELHQKRAELDKESFKINTLHKNNAIIKNTASLYADIEDMQIEKAHKYLLTKERPITLGGKTDETLRQIKKMHRTAVAQLKEMQYKYDFLLSVFPELATYLDDEQSLAEIAEYDMEDVKENYDRVIDFVPREEYERLTPTERNQLALDRYIEGRKKSARIAGFDYEMYCCHKLRQNGFEVEEFGIQNGLEDLGRDIIAKKGGKTYVIQCKRYKKDCLVHENTICQIFGTSIHYRNTATSEVVPVLITTGEVSKTAREFAEILNVEIRQWEMEDYPRIKANINNGQKIYHLPFDQQYWRTIIEPEKGEGYYMTVAEVEQNGFRRAMRHTFA